MMFSQSLNFAGIYLFLYFGCGLKGLAVNAIIYGMISVMLAVILAFFLLPQLKISISNNMKETFLVC